MMQRVPTPQILFGGYFERMRNDMSDNSRKQVRPRTLN